MGLQVWLPLNGDLKNNGLTSGIAVVTSSGATVNNSNGKIGKTYLFDANDDYISIDSEKLRNCFRGGNYPFTIAMWIYNTKTTGSRGTLFGDFNLSGTINFNLELNSSAGNWNNDVRFYWNGTPDYRASGTNVATNTWIHIAIVYDGTKIDFYRNGILVNTRTGTLADKNKTSGAFYLGRDGRTGGTAFGGYINDFRVYDEALSKKQIREISKCLIMHYPLKGVNANQNLFKGTNLGINGWVYNVGDRWAKTLEEVKWKGVRAAKFGITDGNISSTSNWMVAEFRTQSFSNIVLKPATNYIISFDTDANWIRSCSFKAGNATHNLGSANSTPYKTLSDGTYHYTIPITTVEASSENWTYDDQWLYMQYWLPVNTFGTIANLKLEEGTIETMWIPHTDDAIYTLLGYDSMLAVDNAGYDYRATLSNGTFLFSTDSPRYDGCTNFSTNTCYLQIPTMDMSGFANSFTIAYWEKIENMSGKMAWGFGDGNRLNIYPTGSVICCNTGDSANNPYQNNGTSIGFSQWNNGWHHFVMTADGTSNKLYVDGELQGISKTYKGITGTKLYISGWASNTTNYRWTGGLLSDFRIYATPLSAEDILALYQDGGIIDKKNGVYAYEFKEE